MPALVAWKSGCSPANAHTIATIAGRLEEFPRCVQGMREGRLSLDQVGVIAARAGELGGSVVVPPFDAPWVRTTVLADPRGASFSASKFVLENKDL